jgi:hypothetical protein
MPDASENFEGFIFLTLNIFFQNSKKTSFEYLKPAFTEAGTAL